MEKTTQIREIVETAVINLRQAAEVNTIVGKPIQTEYGSVLPVSQVTFAFVAGGGEYGANDKGDEKFAGATGGGATLTPVGFLVISDGGVRMVTGSEQSRIDKLAEIAKDIFTHANRKY